MSIRLPFFNNKETEVKKDSSDENIIENVPNHIAIIMDGNGRWANRRGLPRVAGHKEGMDVVQKVVRTAVHYNIKVLTMYAFSTENWKRPKPEVEYLMRLPKMFLNVYLPELIEQNVKINIIGELEALPKHTKKVVLHAMEKTENNTGLLLNFALNYGSRNEIITAVEKIIDDVEAGNITKDAITEEVFTNYLYTNSFSDPDLIIRTSGEQRLSNFLLWQSAYSELWFTDTLWPDFTAEKFEEALYEYQSRIRRYGGV
ncbi:MAG TPA: isoprenyl transferase [Pseudogracilibacillus sp.]|nr:isoprenyl transferase [Pseudogracilibacillus sp.]